MVERSSLMAHMSAEDLAAENRVVRAAERLRDALNKAREGNYLNAVSGYLDRADIEALVDGVLGVDPAEQERTFALGNGIVLRNIHDETDCEGRPCVIHHPSDHHMKEWPLNWRDGGMFDIKPAHFERICPHGIGHPDPDSMAYQRLLGVDVGTHGCDGCCAPAPIAGRHP